MKRLRFQSGYGDGVAVVWGQVLSVSMIPNSTAPNEGSYVQIDQCFPIFVPAGSSLNLTADEFAYVSCDCECWPDDRQIEIIFGGDATIPVDVTPTPPIGGAPISWLVVYLAG